MSSRKQLLVRSLLTALVLLVIGALGLSRQFYVEALEDAFFGLALASVVILHQRIRPNWMDAALTALGTMGLGLVDFRLLHYPQKLMAWFSFLGLSSFAIMAVRSIWGQDRRRLLYAWIPAAAFVMSDYFASTMLGWTGDAHPKTLDLYLLSFDGSMRTQIAFAAGQLYARFPAVHITALIAYIGLAIPITTIYAGRLLRFREGAFPAMLALLITGPIGILFYNLFPAAGPHNMFGQSFPFNPFPIADLPRVFLEPAAFQGPRNAMPSLHMAWTVLVWWYSRGLSRAERLIAFVFLVLTAFATMGTGEHWFIDLVVAFPFALFIDASCAYHVSWKDSRRRLAILAGFGVTLAWFASLRYGAKVFWISPIIPWTASAATVGFAYVQQANFGRVASTRQADTAAAVQLPELDLESAKVLVD